MHLMLYGYEKTGSRAARIIRAGKRRQILPDMYQKITTVNKQDKSQNLYPEPKPGNIRIIYPFSDIIHLRFHQKYILYKVFFFSP